MRGRTGRGAADRRLLGYTSGARGYLVVTVAFGLAGTGLILAQAGLLARALAAAARGDVAAALAGRWRHCWSWWRRGRR